MANCERCKPTCVSPDEVSGLTDRQIWDYVRKYYYPRFKYEGQPAHPCDASLVLDPRDATDVSRINDDDYLNSLYQEEHADWISYRDVRVSAGTSYAPFERWLEWKYTHGTDIYGNLPQHKKHTHKGHCWALCPYDTDCNEVRTEIMTGHYIDPFYYNSTISGTIPFTESEKIEHYDIETGKHVYLATASRGSVWGYECTYSGCLYRAYHNKNYFYV